VGLSRRLPCLPGGCRGYADALSENLGDLIGRNYGRLSGLRTYFDK
jgi:hypothetical protein